MSNSDWRLETGEWRFEISSLQSPSRHCGLRAVVRHGSIASRLRTLIGRGGGSGVGPKSDSTAPHEPVAIYAAQMEHARSFCQRGIVHRSPLEAIRGNVAHPPRTVGIHRDHQLRKVCGTRLLHPSAVRSSPHSGRSIH